MQEGTQRGALRRLAVLSGAAVFAVAVATPAHAEDAPPPDPAPTRVTAPAGWELAAKPHPSVISPAQPPRTQRVSASRSTAPPRWYQVPHRQYRTAPASSRIHTRANAVAAPPAAPKRQRKICELYARKCLQFCGPDVRYTASENGRWIRFCNSSSSDPPRLDRLHALLLQRLWSVSRRSASAQQYQCLAAQYQRNQRQSCRGNVQQVSKPKALVPTRRVKTARVQIEGSSHARILAAAVSRERHVPAVVRHTAPGASAQQPAGVREVAPTPTAEASASSDEWLLRTFLILLGTATLAFLAAAAGRPAAGVRARLSSKGLSSSRIDLGDDRHERPRRSGGIAYRD